jgi:RecB family endonuclease NucS
MANESKIRDFFSENLHVIEDGLTLVGKEVTVQLGQTQACQVLHSLK